MNELILSHQSALNYWRSWPSDVAIKHINKNISANLLEDTPCGFSSQDRKTLFARFGIDSSQEDIHILVREDAQKRKLKGVRFHSMGACPPAKSFVAISAKQVIRNNKLYDLLCVSPELCFLQMARVMNFYELVELGYELCGGYSLSSRSDGMESRESPLTSVANLESFIGASDGLHGVRRGRHALQYVADNSWSPKESQIAAMLVLPRRMGGFGISKPIMNKEIHVSGEAARVLQGGKIIPDMYWPDIQTVLEYDSMSKHCDAYSVDHDARKRSAYRLLGLDVVSITLGQLNDFSTFSALADDLYSRFGKRRKKTSASQRAKQREVHNWYMRGMRRASAAHAHSF